MKMKKLMLAFCLMSGAALTVCAQDTTSTQDPQYRTEDMNQGDNIGRESIDPSELPEQVKQSLASQDYSGYTIKNAYRKIEASGEMTYTVKLKGDDGTKRVTYDALGNVIKEKGKGTDKDDY